MAISKTFCQWWCFRFHRQRCQGPRHTRKIVLRADLSPASSSLAMFDTAQRLSWINLPNNAKRTPVPSGRYLFWTGLSPAEPRQLSWRTNGLPMCIDPVVGKVTWPTISDALSGWSLCRFFNAGLYPLVNALRRTSRFVAHHSLPVFTGSLTLNQTRKRTEPASGNLKWPSWSVEARIFCMCCCSSAALFNRVLSM